MKKTFLAILMAGSCAALAQTNPTTTPTTSPTTTPTTPTTSPTTSPVATTPTTTNTTSEPLQVTTNSELNSNTNNTVTPTTSTSWAPGTSPYWGWNSYGMWGNNTNVSSNVNANTNVNMNGSDNTMNANGNMNSSGSYNAYNSSVVVLPPHVQMNVNRDFPATASSGQTWNQYGDWFYSHYVNNGRLSQYYYDARGNGYMLALPVIQTYVPEEIINNALQKYGANLYSIGMIKTADGNNVYHVELIEKGKARTEYLNEDGSSAVNIWRVEETTLTSTEANAGMGDQNASSTEANKEETETKVKWEENGTKTKIKAEDDKLKIKEKKVDD